MRANPSLYTPGVGSRIVLADEEGHVLGKIVFFDVRQLQEETPQQAHDRLATAVASLINSRK